MFPNKPNPLGISRHVNYCSMPLLIIMSTKSFIGAAGYVKNFQNDNHIHALSMPQISPHKILEIPSLPWKVVKTIITPTAMKIEASAMATGINLRNMT